jgi:hypothetical protein
MRFVVGKLANGQHCCTVHPAPGVYIGAVGDDASQALHSAAGLAEKLSEALSEHPELRALMPPQVQLALKTVRIAAWAARNGHLEDVAKKLGPKAAHTIARVLKAVF